MTPVKATRVHARNLAMIIDDQAFYLSLSAVAILPIVTLSLTLNKVDNKIDDKMDDVMRIINDQGDDVTTKIDAQGTKMDAEFRSQRKELNGLKAEMAQGKELKALGVDLNALKLRFDTSGLGLLLVVSIFAILGNAAKVIEFVYGQ